MKKTEHGSTERPAPDDGGNQPPTRAAGQKVLFNTTHQPLPYTAPDGVTVKYLDPKARVAFPTSEMSEEIRAYLRSGVLMDETSATE